VYYNDTFGDPGDDRAGNPWAIELSRKIWPMEAMPLFTAAYAAAGWLANTLDGRFWHDWFHDTLLARSFRRGTGWLSEGFDLPVIDGAANGLAQLIQRAAAGLRSVQTGYVRNYAISVFIGLLLVMSYLLFR